MAEWSVRQSETDMNTQETNEVRELTAAELDDVTGASIGRLLGSVITAPFKAVAAVAETVTPSTESATQG